MRENNLNIQVYSSCNCNCSFCNLKDKRANKIDAKFVVEYVNNHPNINYILLTGGEPTFALDEYIEIIKGISSESRTIVLQTNGWWGENEKVKSAIKNFPPSCVHLSFDYEKQKNIPIEIAIKAYNFLLENNIQAFAVNHTESEEEYLYYESLIPEINKGSICKPEDGDWDCGTALLANNKVGGVNIYGWREINGK